MPRSGYIYHLYQNQKRILSATVKSEILSKIHDKGWTGTEYELRCSGDNGDGEWSIPGWRVRPKVGEKVILLLTTGIISKVLDHTPKGYWMIELECNGSIKYKVKYDGGDKWVIVS